MGALRADGADCLISLAVVCRSSRHAVVGAKNGLIVVCVRVARADGEADAALMATLSAFLGCAKSQLTLIRGPKNREKVVRVSGWSAAQLAEKLGALV